MYSGPIYPDTIPPGWEESIGVERAKYRHRCNVESKKQEEDRRRQEFKRHKRLAQLPAYRRARKVKNKAVTKDRRKSRG